MATGEFDFIRWIRTQQAPSAFVPVPAGDDLAVLTWAPQDLLIVGVDQVLDGVHFDSAVHAPRQIGRKVMNRNLSDCAAMACLPAAAVATVALPAGVGVPYAQELYLGLREAGEMFDCRIVGGDTGSWAGKLVVTVTILGRSAGVAPITRGGAKPGDDIYVTGPLGGSILGRHMTFTPRIALARELAATGAVTAMIDLSDGISRDLKHVCDQSGTGAILDAPAIPIHPDARELAKTDGRDALDHALDDGEDYELLLTARPTAADVFLPFIRSGQIHRIGQMAAAPGIWLNMRNGELAPLEPRAWEHRL